MARPCNWIHLVRGAAADALLAIARRVAPPDPPVDIEDARAKSATWGVPFPDKLPRE